VFLAAAATVAAITPVVRHVSSRFGIIDRPSERKVHPKPTPTAGGVGLLVGVLVGLGVAYLIPSFRAIFHDSSELEGTIIAAVVITSVGLVDDVRALSAPAKIAGQVLTAGILILFGVELLFFWFPFGQGVVVPAADLAVPITVVWVLVMVNAVNLIDGLDGLAAGIVIIAAVAFFIYIRNSPEPVPVGEPASPSALLAAVVAGAAVGFLPYNFHPARIFMGDSGSGLLGTLLAAATISGVGRTLAPSGGDIAAFSIPILLPFVMLAVALVDVAMAVVRRLRRGRPVFAPDKEHIHYQLQAIGNSHRRAVLILYVWSVLIAGSALAVTFIDGRLLVGGILLVVAVVITATFLPQRLLQSRRRKRALVSAEGPGAMAATKPAASPVPETGAASDTA